MPDISIIIPTLDPDPQFSWERDLAASSVDAEVIVRDDPSASGARNAGIEAATTDKLVFLDDDSVPRPGYFELVSELLDEHHAVTGRIVDTGWRYTRGLSSQYDQGEEGHVTDVVVGCSMAFRREVLEDVGGFDDRLPYGHEEAELASRVSAAYDIWYEPELVVEHPFADSLFDYYGKAYRHGREAITLYAVREEGILSNVVRHVATPSRYLGPSVVGTAIKATGHVVYLGGLLRGIVESVRRDDTASPDRLSN